MEVALLLVAGIAGVTLWLASQAARAVRSGASHSGATALQARQAETEQRLSTVLMEAAGGRSSRVGAYRDDESGEEVETGLRFTVAGLSRDLSIERVRERRRSANLDDPDFDGLVDVMGPRPFVLAILNAECRAAIRGLLRGSVRVTTLNLESGELEVRVPTSGFAHEHPGLGQAAEAIGSLARHFASPPDVVPLLAHNAARDPNPGVRLRNLDALVGEYGHDPRTITAVRQALRDVDAGVRLRAALAAGREGEEVLLALALDTSAPDDCSAGAIDALGSQLPLERIDLLIRQAAYGDASGRPRAIAALIRVLGRNPASRALEALARLAQTADDSLGPAVIDAIVAIPREPAERALIDVLATWAIGRRRTVQAAAHRLGEQGTADAVLPLKEAAARHGGTVASAARQAIAAIQSRLSGTPGELALAGDQDGRLTLSTDENGRVSLPNPEPGRD